MSGDDPLSGLAPPQRKAILALVRGETKKQAAKRAHVSPRTLRRWLADPDVSAAYERLAERTYREGELKARAGYTAAIETTLEILKDPDAKHADRLNAVRLLVDAGSKARDQSKVAAAEESAELDRLVRRP